MPFFNIPSGAGGGESNSFPVLTGQGAPSDSIGADGQLFIDALNGLVYVKDGGTWGGGISLGVDEWQELQGKPTEFPPASHGHVVADVDGLQALIDGKAATAHGHAIADVDGLATALDGKAAAQHNHAIADVDGLGTALDGKADALHTHEIAAVNGLQAALDNLAAGTGGIAWVSAPAESNTPAAAGSVAYDANYLYLAVAENSWKRISLASWAAPVVTITITQQPTNQTAVDGAATFTVAATVSNGEPASYQWQTSGDSGATWQDIAGETAGTLALSALVVDDNGNEYRAIVSAANADTQTSNAATLTVTAPPTNAILAESGDTLLVESGDTLWHDGIESPPTVITITAQPQNATASNGSATFSVTAETNDGTPIEYQWQGATEDLLANAWTSTIFRPQVGESLYGFTGLTFGAGGFVGIFEPSGTGSNNLAGVSADGSAWNAVSLPAARDWEVIAYGNGKYVVAAWNSDGVVLTSPDAQNWTAHFSALPSTTQSLIALIYANNQFVGSRDGTKIVTSADGISWTEITTNIPNTAAFPVLAFGNSVYLLIQQSDGSVYTSTDLATWQASQTPANAALGFVTFGNGLFVAIGSSSGAPTIFTTSDGSSWNEIPMPAGITGYGRVTFGAGLFVAPYAGGVAVSSDGITWRFDSAQSVQPSDGLAFGGGAFVSVTNNGNVARNAIALTFQDIQNASQSSLALSGLTESDHGREYRVELNAGSAAAVVSNSATLTVSQ